MDRLKNRYRNQLRQFQKQGYDFFSKGSYDDAIDSWRPMWTLLDEMLRGTDRLTVDDVNSALVEPLGKWSADYLQALNLSFTDITVELEQIRPILQTLLSLPGNTKVFERRNQQRLLADSVFKVSGYEIGDSLYESLLMADANWGWGWISWAHHYSFGQKSAWHDPKKAETILRRALANEQLENRRDVMEKLRDVLLQMGRASEASGLDLSSKGLLEGLSRWMERNRLCPCGSGRKYKNCCGRH